MTTFDGLLGLALGIGLAAACGFRVFVPLLVAGVAAKAGYLELAGGFPWMASNLAIAIFAVATVLEIAAYWVPCSAPIGNWRNGPWSGCVAREVPNTGGKTTTRSAAAHGARLQQR